MQTIVRAINSSAPLYNDGVIVVADDTNSVYADSRITGCAIAATAVD